MKTQSKEYSNRLEDTQLAWWKRLLPLSLPYQWNLRRLNPGRMLEIGCGIGRCLGFTLEAGVGIDHNPHAIELCKKRGFTAYLPNDFQKSADNRPHAYDSLLFSHVLEHMTPSESVQLIKEYLPYLKPDGKVILITPQEVGQKSDPTHVEFMDFKKLNEILALAGLSADQSYSFPFPRWVGNHFIYNEFVVTGKTPS